MSRMSAKRHNGVDANGQVAIGFIVLMGFILALVSMVINLGQTASVRVETSNASDAGALAAASWIASGQNEASWIARKIADGNQMVNNIFLVPLSYDSMSAAYGDQLWNALLTNPSSPGGKCSYQGAWGYDGCGPSGYFREIANGAMEAAHHLAARDFLTASLDNMMMRYNTGPDALGNDFGSLPGSILSAQQDQDASGSITNIDLGGVLQWNNGQPLDSKWHLTHQPHYLIQGPSSAPTMPMRAPDPATEPASYYYYGKADTSGHFPCNFPATAILNTTGPFPISPTSTVGSLPFDVNSQGNKQYDVDLRAGSPPIMPALNDSTMQVSSVPGGVCGLNKVDLSGNMDPVTNVVLSSTIVPQPIQLLPGNKNTLQVTVSHEVVQPDGSGVSSDGIVTWITKFPAVASSATAQFTSPTPADPADPSALTTPWVEPSRDAHSDLLCVDQGC